MTRAIRGKAEVALEYPDKFYVGTLDADSRWHPDVGHRSELARALSTFESALSR